MPNTPNPFKKTQLSINIGSMFELQTRGENRAQDRSAVPLSYDCSVSDMQLIIRIATRAAEMAKELGIPIDPQRVGMDIATVHCNGLPLRLLGILLSDVPDFQHDVGGICNRLDRSTGKLMYGWLPKFVETAQ